MCLALLMKNKITGSAVYYYFLGGVGRKQNCCLWTVHVLVVLLALGVINQTLTYLFF